MSPCFRQARSRSGTAATRQSPPKLCTRFQSDGAPTVPGGHCKRLRHSNSTRGVHGAHAAVHAVLIFLFLFTGLIFMNDWNKIVYVSPSIAFRALRFRDVHDCRDLCFNDLFNWNTWMYTQRREMPLGMLSYGESAYASYAPDGTPASTKPFPGAGLGSGLDNGPTVENVSASGGSRFISIRGSDQDNVMLSVQCSAVHIHASLMLFLVKPSCWVVSASAYLHESHAIHACARR